MFLFPYRPGYESLFLREGKESSETEIGLRKFLGQMQEKSWKVCHAWISKKDVERRFLNLIQRDGENNRDEENKFSVKVLFGR